MIAALYVQPDGCYANLPGVDAWDEQRDARLSKRQRAATPPAFRDALLALATTAAATGHSSSHPAQPKAQ